MSDFGEWEFEQAMGTSLGEFMDEDWEHAGYTPRFDPPASLIFEVDHDAAVVWLDTLLAAWDDIREDVEWSRWYEEHLAALGRQDRSWMIAFGSHPRLRLVPDRECSVLEVPIGDPPVAGDLGTYMRDLLLTFFVLLARERSVQAPPPAASRPGSSRR